MDCPEIRLLIPSLSSPDNVADFSQLLPDLLSLCFSFLPLPYLLEARRVCRHWYVVSHRRGSFYSLSSVEPRVLVDPFHNLSLSSLLQSMPLCSRLSLVEQDYSYQMFPVIRRLWKNYPMIWDLQQAINQLGTWTQTAATATEPAGKKPPLIPVFSPSSVSHLSILRRRDRCHPLSPSLWISLFSVLSNLVSLDLSCHGYRGNKGYISEKLRYPRHIRALEADHYEMFRAISVLRLQSLILPFWCTGPLLRTATQESVMVQDETIVILPTESLSLTLCGQSLLNLTFPVVAHLAGDRVAAVISAAACLTGLQKFAVDWQDYTEFPDLLSSSTALSALQHCTQLTVLDLSGTREVEEVIELLLPKIGAKLLELRLPAGPIAERSIERIPQLCTQLTSLSFTLPSLEMGDPDPLLLNPLTLLEHLNVLGLDWHEIWEGDAFDPVALPRSPVKLPPLPHLHTLIISSISLRHVSEMLRLADTQLPELVSLTLVTTGGIPDVGLSNALTTHMPCHRVTRFDNEYDRKHRIICSGVYLSNSGADDLPRNGPQWHPAPHPYQQLSTLTTLVLECYVVPNVLHFLQHIPSLTSLSLLQHSFGRLNNADRERFEESQPECCRVIDDCSLLFLSLLPTLKHLRIRGLHTLTVGVFPVLSCCAALQTLSLEKCTGLRVADLPMIGVFDHKSEEPQPEQPLGLPPQAVALHSLSVTDCPLFPPCHASHMRMRMVEWARYVNRPNNVEYAGHMMQTVLSAKTDMVDMSVLNALESFWPADLSVGTVCMNPRVQPLASILSLSPPPRSVFAHGPAVMPLYPARPAKANPTRYRDWLSALCCFPLLYLLALLLGIIVGATALTALVVLIAVIITVLVLWCTWDGCYRQPRQLGWRMWCFGIIDCCCCSCR